jgi:hypothetical protein
MDFSEDAKKKYKKTCQINVKLTAPELAEIKNASIVENRTMSSYLLNAHRQHFIRLLRPIN